MALEATHIRFALDLKSDYQVQNLDKYISGTIYPDSRYITKIRRELTHNDDVLSLEFAKDDFRKGWQAHQICDNIQLLIYRKYLKFIDLSDPGNDGFVGFSSVKIIQDMFDMQQFNLQENLKHLRYYETPNKEDRELVKKYNQIIISLYHGKKITTVDDNFNMWLLLGVDKGLGEKIKQNLKLFLDDRSIVKQIENCYGLMIGYYKKEFNRQ